VVVEWGAVTDGGLPTGNSAVTAYELLWDNGDAALTTFVPLTLTTDLATSHTIVGVTEGASYRFVVRAVNIYGTGTDSSEATIRASDVPSRMATLSTTRTSLSVLAQWAEPSDNGAAVTAYRIELWDPSTAAYVEDTSRCDGSSASVISDRYCTFVFTDLMSTYAYAVGDLFVVRAQA
jgi:predicted phage tail protein